jgi:ABC-2 type transport system permease protein
MHTVRIGIRGLLGQFAVEFKLFWRRRQAVYLTFLVPMLGMALFVYLGKEGMLESFFRLVTRGLGTGGDLSVVGSPMEFLTVGLIAYSLIDVAFETLVPNVVRDRDSGILKRLGGTPLRRGTFALAKALNASVLVLAEVAVILMMGLASSEITVAGDLWSMAVVLLLGVFTFTALSFVLSGIMATVGSAIAGVHAIYIPMILLCGAFVPISALPKALRTVAQILPLTYFVRPFRSIMLDGAGLTASGGDLLILLAWAVGAWLVAIKVFRWE